MWGAPNEKNSCANTRAAPQRINMPNPVQKVGGIHAQWAQGGGLSCLWPEGAATSVVQLNQSSGHLVEQSANDDEGSQNPATAFFPQVLPLELDRAAPCGETLYLFITGCSAACALPRHALPPLPPPPPPALRAPRPPPRPRSSDVGGWDPPATEPCPGWASWAAAPPAASWAARVLRAPHGDFGPRRCPRRGAQ